ncbi:heme biosynthesis protein HemY [Terrihabitans sp. B22-R8]|uniref:heme biosynthesis protein HemY n=1 Tax=Terrihabitans sp. B22-R8 TaxID=3425128 RepID=UPI00403C69F5
MIRILAFLVVIALATLGASWLIDRPGAITIVWQGMRIDTSVPVAVLAVVVLTIALLLLWWFFRTIFQIPESISDFMRGRRRKRGLSAVAHGLVAIGVGDGRAARRSATEARRLIGDEPLTLLLRAQAAQLSGDRAEAENAFRSMLEREETRSLGYRGLFVEARRRGDDQDALQAARHAAEADPRVPWAGPALLEMQSAAGDWDGALQTVERNVSAKTTERSIGRRQRAVLLTAKAIDLTDLNPEEARSYAVDAVSIAPDLVPAAALAGRLLAEAGDYRKATRIVEKTWKAQPHPDLAEVYLHIRPGDAALDRLNRAQTLHDRAAGNVEGSLVLARAALDAREFALARRTLQPLVDAGATRRVCLLMAELDKAEFQDRGRARAWLARALVAAPDPAWIADGAVSQEWQPVSPAGRLDAYVWEVPVERLSAADSRLIEQEIAEEQASADDEPVPEVMAESVPPLQEAEPASSAQPVVAVEPPLEEPAPSLPRAPAEKTKPPSRVPPQEIVLPLGHAPDDPGPDTDDDLDRRITTRVGP